MEFIIILLLILLNGIFSMSEIAVVSARKPKLGAAARKGDKKAKKALDLANSPTRFLSTVQIGITLIGILTGIYSGEKITDDVAALINGIALLQPYSESIAVAVVLILVTFFSLVLGELLPKRIGLTMPERIAKTVARPMELLSVVTAPFIWLLIKTTDFLIRLFGIRKTSDSEITEEEIRAIIQEGTSAGAIEEIEQDIVENVFRLGERSVSSLMTQRMDITWLNVNDPLDVTKSILTTTTHKLYPVCENDLDHVLGVLFIKDIIRSTIEGKELDIRKLITTPVYLPESIKAYKALEEMRLKGTSVALVINEFGGVQGLLTINDIVDTLVNDFSEDLYKQNEIIEREDGSFLVDASISMHEFCRFFDIEMETFGGFSTVGGLILDHAGRLPETGYKLNWNGLIIEVVDLDGMRIDKVIAQKAP